MKRRTPWGGSAFVHRGWASGTFGADILFLLQGRVRARRLVEPEHRLKGVRRARAGSNRSHGISGPPIAERIMIADRLAMMPGDCETREGARQQRKSAIQQKHELPEIITQTKIFKGIAERPPHSGSGIGLNCTHFQSMIRPTR